MIPTPSGFRFMLRIILLPAVCLVTWTSAGPVRIFSCGRLYYRTFFLDSHSSTLFVGGMNHMFKLNLDNINASSCHSPKFEPDFRRRCENIIGKSKHFHCQNHIRVIQPLAKGQYLYVCGTNAYRPKDWIAHSGNLTEVQGISFPGIGDGIAKCPFDPEDNSTAVWVEHGNPGNYPALYSGTVADVSRADHLIFRSDLYDSRSTLAHSYLRSIEYDTKWLDTPQFVGSYEIDEYVYFFFRENAIEYTNAGKNVYARVARVCKRDTGGRNVLEQNWSTYTKARINCSIPGEYPYYFNQIQSIVKADTPRTSAVTFYATFTSSLNGAADAGGFQGSAICAFTLEDIEKAFNGRFKEQASVSAAWLPVLKSDVPEPRPGRCMEDTKNLPDSVLTFIKNHPIMDAAVAHQYGQPLFYQHGLTLTKLAVVQTIAEGYEYSVFFAASNTGVVHKIIHWYDSIKQSVESRLLDVWVTLEGEAIRAMTVSNEHRSVYASTDTKVAQFSFASCHNHRHCSSCVRDPFCVWSRENSKCEEIASISESLKWRPDPNFLQDVRQERVLVCDECVKWQNTSALLGQTVFLPCRYQTSYSPEKAKDVFWVHNKARLDKELRKHRLHRTEEGLLLTEIRPSDAGSYEMYSGHDVVCRFSLGVDQESCQTPRSEAEYKKVYRDWCDEFQKYKKHMQAWQKSKEACMKQHINAV
ncbi:semaphorin-2A-like [Paramacrobiotus metropolitanus]|uniref:semaphorin-2A-like n=1 Tax=Paramacrobiotus metropolitanus TaxID=2943436 RepID=UPI00244629DC|nr:semaphorin-2A-like [Paramacrobiotus metropolitanus]